MDEEGRLQLPALTTLVVDAAHELWPLLDKPAKLKAEGAAPECFRFNTPFSQAPLERRFRDVRLRFFSATRFGAWDHRRSAQHATVDARLLVRGYPGCLNTVPHSFPAACAAWQAAMAPISLRLPLPWGLTLRTYRRRTSRGRQSGSVTGQVFLDAEFGVKRRMQRPRSERFGCRPDDLSLSISLTWWTAQDRRGGGSNQVALASAPTRIL